MSLQTMLAVIFTILASVCLVAVIILLGWFLIWKAFLSKFRLVRELLGQTVDEDDPSSPQQQNTQQLQLKRNQKFSQLHLEHQQNQQVSILDPLKARKAPKKD